MFGVGDIVEVVGMSNLECPDAPKDAFGVGAILRVNICDPEDVGSAYRCNYLDDDQDISVWFPEKSLKLIERRRVK